MTIEAYILLVTLVASNLLWYLLTGHRSRQYHELLLSSALQYATYYVSFNILYKGVKALDEEQRDKILHPATTRRTAARIEQIVYNMTGYEVAVDNLSIVPNNPEKQNAE